MSDSNSVTLDFKTKFNSQWSELHSYLKKFKASDVTTITTSIPADHNLLAEIVKLLNTEHVKYTRIDRIEKNEFVIWLSEPVSILTNILNILEAYFQTPEFGARIERMKERIER